MHGNGSYLEKLKLFLFSNDELMNGIVFESELSECIRDLFLFFISSFLRRLFTYYLRKKFLPMKE